MPLYGQVQWTQPTAAELKMTSEAKAPGADAIYLNYDDDLNVPEHFEQVYAAIKVLTADGRGYGDIHIYYPAGAVDIVAIEGRTIHSDGTVIPFTGKPYDKLVQKQNGERLMAKVFSLPDVQTGSVLEYQFRVLLSHGIEGLVAPQWNLQRNLFVKKAHYQFISAKLSPNTYPNVLVPNPEGKLTLATKLQYDSSLPPGAKFKDTSAGEDLVVKDVPAIPDEPYSPPLGSYSYRLYYFYTGNYSAKDYWKGAGKAWSRRVNSFAAVTPQIRQAAAQITAGATTPAQKLEKIYAAVMTVANTDYTRALSQQEERAKGIHIRDAADVWTEKQGTSNQITRLFIALARAEGLDAEAMIVPQRNVRVLNADDLDWSQLTDELAMVMVNGQPTYFDPGERYCEFGKLAWVHQQVLGMRQDGHGAVPQLTPGATYKDTVVDRQATLHLNADGTMTGTVRIAMTGAVALQWRHRALRKDAQAAEKAFSNKLEQEVPASVRVQGTTFTGLTDPSQALVAEVQVSGTMGSQAGKQVIVPGSFFEAQEKPLFVAGTRQNPVDLDYPRLVRDGVKVILGPGLKVDAVPTSEQLPYPQNAEFITKYAGSGQVYQQARLLALGNVLYKATDYPQLKAFFQKLAAQDQQQVVLTKVKKGMENGTGGGMG
jgi:hypothetical protein